MSQQPVWKFVGSLGDVNPLENCGCFVYVDETGVYEPEAEEIQPLFEGYEVTIYRFILKTCTYKNGILSDNKFHPDKSAWFAGTEAKRILRPQDSTYLKNIADYSGTPLEELIKYFCSADPLTRAVAWRDVGMYHGFDDLDNCPLIISVASAKKRYAAELKKIS